MTSISKILLIGAVAMSAVSVTAGPSFAKKHKMAMASCTPGMTCTAPGSGNGLSRVMACGGDGKWYGALFTPYCVTGTICPPACH